MTNTIDSFKRLRKLQEADNSNQAAPPAGGNQQGNDKGGSPTDAIATEAGKQINTILKDALSKAANLNQQQPSNNTEEKPPANNDNTPQQGGNNPQQGNQQQQGAQK